MGVTGPRDRLASIDMVKGWAIIGVTLIHSTALGYSRWMTWGFFHAVPVFLVLFGLNSEQWFRRHTGRDQISEWYGRSVKRILIPAWATIAVWWLLVLTLEPAIVRVTISLPFYHLIGYTKQIGMGWFVSVIIQLVILFPLFH